MIIEKLKLNLDVKDAEFDSIYPARIRKVGRRQWTPIAVAKAAAKYLGEIPGTRVLDIGSGVGKFCMVGACQTQSHFTGVEQRLQLVEISNELKYHYGLENLSYLHANITEVPFAEYDAFYFFNSFYENIDRTALIDSTTKRGIDFYYLYTRYVCGQLEKMPVGTRLVAYWSQLQEVPGSYRLLFSDFGEDLKFFKKIS